MLRNTLKFARFESTFLSDRVSQISFSNRSTPTITDRLPFFYISCVDELGKDGDNVWQLSHGFEIGIITKLPPSLPCFFLFEQVTVKSYNGSTHQWRAILWRLLQTIGYHNCCLEWFLFLHRLLYYVWCTWIGLRTLMHKCWQLIDK